MEAYEKILLEIVQEREYQLKKWGNHNDDWFNGPMEWAGYINVYAMKWFRGGFPPYSRQNFREAMVKVGALALAAIEWADRAQVNAAYRKGNDGSLCSRQGQQPLAQPMDLDYEVLGMKAPKKAPMQQKKSRATDVTCS